MERQVQTGANYAGCEVISRAIYFASSTGGQHLDDPFGDENEKKGLMLPPPIPVKTNKGQEDKSVPPRMTRLPSLKQLSERLQSTSSNPSSQQPNPLDNSPASSSSNPLRISTNSVALQSSSTASHTSPIMTPTSTGRLKLPASAMMRSLSAGSNGSAPSGLSPIISSPVIASSLGSVQGQGHSPTSAPLTPAQQLAKFVPGGLGDFHPASGPESSTSMSRSASHEVEGFARHFNNVRLPSQLTPSSNYHLFKNGIRPMWEDPANAHGGKWVILFRSSPGTLDIAWANLTMALVGEILDPENQVCGIVGSARPKVDRLQVWTRSKDDVESLNQLGKKIVEIMALEGRDADSMSMEYQYNTNDSRPPPNRFIHISYSSRAPPTPSRSMSSAFQGPPGSFGGMGQARTLSSSGVNLTHPLPLPPHSPAVTKGDHGSANDAAGMKRGSTNGNPFAGPLDLVRQENYGSKEGMTGV
ncbi:translation initiation factor 4E [Cryptococcus deuterogattii LA55]|nr:translation initiation factor 4E [Cryptococcus deuterogattii LA55]KIR35249.1 translation initiation factor 4E [Cryptococcus deuterogattii MMRL2647]KIR72053.1 translation initiation factor 4E [Cryptococcus deuterogattii CA1014]KIR93614.1 translation initiation factor 4E [Cryptococcus deuterogattii CBS 10090]